MLLRIGSSRTQTRQRVCKCARILGKLCRIVFSEALNRSFSRGNSRHQLVIKLDILFIEGDFRVRGHRYHDHAFLMETAAVRRHTPHPGICEAGLRMYDQHSLAAKV